MKTDILDDDFILQRPPKILKNRVYIIFACFILVGIFFRWRAWAFSSLILLWSSAGLFAYAANGFLSVSERNVLNSVVSTLGLLWTMLLIWGASIPGGYKHLYTYIGLIVYLILFAINFLIYFFHLKHQLRIRKDFPKLSEENYPPEPDQ